MERDVSFIVRATCLKSASLGGATASFFLFFFFCPFLNNHNVSSEALTSRTLNARGSPIPAGVDTFAEEFARPAR